MTLNAESEFLSLFVHGYKRTESWYTLPLRQQQLVAKFCKPPPDCDLTMARARGWADRWFVGPIDNPAQPHMVAPPHAHTRAQTKLSQDRSLEFVYIINSRTNPKHSSCNLQPPCLGWIPALTCLHLFTLTSQPLPHADTRRPRLQTTTHTSKKSKVECRFTYINTPTHICINVLTKKRVVYICKHTHTHIHICTHKDKPLCITEQINTHTHICTHADKRRGYIRKYMHTRVNSAYIYVNVYTHTCKFVCIHVKIYTHTYKLCVYIRKRMHAHM